MPLNGNKVHPEPDAPRSVSNLSDSAYASHAVPEGEAPSTPTASSRVVSTVRPPGAVGWSIGFADGSVRGMKDDTSASRTSGGAPGIRKPLPGQGVETSGKSYSRSQSRWSSILTRKPFEEVSRNLVPRSFFIFSKNSFPRKQIIIVVTHGMFDMVMLLFIAANCVTLAMESNEPDFDSTRTGKTLILFEDIFLGVFTLEVIMKLIAYGAVWGPNTYFRDGWNILDFFVVALGYLEFAKFGNYTAIRSIRVLRPLRAITKIERMRIIVVTLLKSLHMLFDVAVLALFFYVVFGVLCTQLFAGQLRYRCGVPDFTYATVSADGSVSNVSYSVQDADSEDVCNAPLTSSLTWSAATDNGSSVTYVAAGVDEGAGGHVCRWEAYPSGGDDADPDFPNGKYCVVYGNPDTYRHFDNILWSWLTIFQCVTMTDWVFTMYDCQDAVSVWVWPVFLFMVVLGALFIINLALAVLYLQFTKDRAAIEGPVEKQAVEFHEVFDPSVMEATYDDEDEDDDGVAMAAAGKVDKASAATAAIAPTTATKAAATIASTTNTKLAKPAAAATATADISTRTKPSRRDASYSEYTEFGQSDAEDAGPNSIVQEIQEQEGVRVHGHGWWQRLRALCRRVAYSKKLEFMTTTVIIINSIFMALTWYRMPVDLVTASTYANYVFTMYFLLELMIKLTGMGFRRYFRDGMNRFDAVVVVASLVEMAIDLSPLTSAFGNTLSVLRGFRLLRVLRLARSWKDLNDIIRALMSSMASVGYLTLLLLLFMFIVALLGMQLFGYQFDTCDTASAQQLCPPGVEDCPSHRDCYVQCDLVTATTDGVDGSGQYIGWFQVDGSPYGGYALCEAFPRDASSGQEVEYWAHVGKANTPRAHFDDIFQSFVTVFQILTFDNWPGILHNGMDAVSPWAALYFIMVIVVGNYMILNLFLAILLDGFGQLEEEEDDKKSVAGNSVAPTPNPSTSKGKDSSRGKEGPKREDSGSKPAGWMAQLLGRSDPSETDPLSKVCTFSNSFYVPRNAKQQTGLAFGGDAPVIDNSPFGASRRPSEASRHGWGDETGVGLAGARAAGATSGKNLLWESVPPLQPTADPAGDIAQQTTGLSRTPGRSKSGLTGAGALGTMRSTFAGATHGHLRRGSTAATGRGAAGGVGSVFPMSADLSKYKTLDMMRGRSLFIFSPSNPIRFLAAKIVTNPYFEQFMLFLIIVSSVSLCLETPDVENHRMLFKTLRMLDIVLTAIFLAEAVLKIVMMGLIFNGRGSYLRSSWNWLDLFVASIGVAVVVVEAMDKSVNLTWLRALRAIRALRPLRMASRAEGIRIVVTAMFKAIPALGKVAMVAMLFYFIFTVLALNILMGRFYSCNDPDGNMIDPYYVLPDGATLDGDWCSMSDTITITASAYHSRLPGNVSVPPWNLTTTWDLPLQNFDNVYVGIWTLFQMATLEGWSDVMYLAADTTDPESQPLRDATAPIKIYFVVFIIVGSFLMINLVIGVSIDRFNKMKAEAAGGSIFMTEEQQQWCTIQRMLTVTRLHTRYVPPLNRFRAMVFKFVYNWVFDWAMMAIIGINILFMMMLHADMSTEFEHMLSWANVVFTAIFIVELLLKWTAIGVRTYFRDGWNIFDACVVVASTVGVLIDLLTPQQLTFMPLVRILRVMRIFRLIPRAKGLRTLLQTLVWSLPALLNVGAVLLLFMFIFAIVAMNLFGNIKYQSQITRHANFESFPLGLLTLFRIMTGENWHQLMQECMVQVGCYYVREDFQSPTTGNWVYKGQFYDPKAPELDGVPSRITENQCSPLPMLAVIFFCTFTIFCNFMLLQLVIGIIIDNIQNINYVEELAVGQSHILKFVETWEDLDPHATMYIEVYKLTTLLLALEPPLGVRGCDSGMMKVQEIVMAVDIPNRGNKVHFLETLHALAGRVAGAELPPEEEQKLHGKLVERLPKNDLPKYTAAHFYAAMYVRGAVRGYLARHHLKPLWDELDNPSNPLDDDTRHHILKQLGLQVQQGGAGRRFMAALRNSMRLVANLGTHRRGAAHDNGANQLGRISEDITTPTGTGQLRRSQNGAAGGSVPAPRAGAGRLSGDGDAVPETVVEEEEGGGEASGASQARRMLSPWQSIKRGMRVSGPGASPGPAASEAAQGSVGPPGQQPSPPRLPSPTLAPAGARSARHPSQLVMSPAAAASQGARIGLEAVLAPDVPSSTEAVAVDHVVPGQVPDATPLPQQHRAPSSPGSSSSPGPGSEAGLVFGPRSGSPGRQPARLSSPSQGGGGAAAGTTEWPGLSVATSVRPGSPSGVGPMGAPSRASSGLPQPPQPHSPLRGGSPAAAPASPSGSLAGDAAQRAAPSFSAAAAQPQVPAAEKPLPRPSSSRPATTPPPNSNNGSWQAPLGALGLGATTSVGPGQSLGGGVAESVGVAVMEGSGRGSRIGGLLGAAGGTQSAPGTPARMGRRAVQQSDVPPPPVQQAFELQAPEALAAMVGLRAVGRPPVPAPMDLSSSGASWRAE